VINNTALLVALQNHPRLSALQLGRLNKRTLHDALQNIGNKYLGHFKIPGEVWRHLHVLCRYDFWRNASPEAAIEAYKKWLTTLDNPQSYDDDKKSFDDESPFR